MPIYAYHTVVYDSESNPKHLATSIVKWLIDSECSISMTPYYSDLIEDIEPNHSNVEVGTGVLTPAPFQGTVKIRIEDVYDDKKCYVLLHNIYFIPGLNRRSLSVRQWNVTGGEITFHTNHCLITICDSISGTVDTFAVNPPMQQ